jgi:hypothetical protein
MTRSVTIFKSLGLIGLLALFVGIGAAVFFFGGFFDVAANHPDPDVVNWALIQVRKASIARHATDQPRASLEDPALVRAGAQAFSQVGCIYCHGGPGVKPAKFSEGPVARHSGPHRRHRIPNLQTTLPQLTARRAYRGAG